LNEFLKGSKQGFPIAIGYLPIALTFGILSVQTGLTPWQATGMSIWVFAGASQFIAVNLLQSHVLISEIIITTFILNLRHLLMSTSLSRKLNTKPFTSSLLSFGITDETFVVASVHQDESTITAPYFLGLELTAYSGWVFGTLLGSLFSNFIPNEWATGMSIALYSMFIGLLVPSMKKSWQISFIAFLGGIMSWGLTILLPSLSNGWIIILATFVAATIGSFLPNQEVKIS